HRVARVFEPSTFTDAIDADYVRLVLDRARLQESHPVLTSRGRPVRGNHVAIGRMRERPELVREPQVVADEERARRALDVNREKAIAGAVVTMFVSVAEGMDLGVAVHHAIRRGQDELVERELWAFRTLRHGPAHPHAVGAGLVGEESRARPVDRL